METTVFARLKSLCECPIEEAIKPDFDEDWADLIPPELIAIWQELSETERLVAFIVANRAADQLLRISVDDIDRSCSG